MMVLFMIGGSSNESDTTTEENMELSTQNISENVMKWKSEIEAACKKYGISDYVDVVLAIIMVESGGSVPDLMQSSESLGLPMNTIKSEKESIDAGVKHLAKCVELAKSKGTDYWSAVGAYNFGSNYINFLANNGKKHTIELADKYSLTVVAPSLGNSTGARYSYSHPVAISYNGGYLYWNGGNFFYVARVQEYLKSSASSGSSDASGWKAEALKNARNDIGNTYPTGWGNRGECMVAVQMWINGVRQGSWIPGGVRTGYLQSGAIEVPWTSAKSGDVIQYESLSSPDTFAVGVHTMFVEKINSDGSIHVIESNVPGGSGLVGERTVKQSDAPSGWRSVVWRFPDQ
ncbi:lysozyme family protein [Enterococcus sp. BWM-S5]|uniref:Lysozyme family protein n=2 Tax=Enterococcus larvae TaxID=2794352 RepID=A0ABS4CKL1_9ENTE|nr:lysozyme family protein [Enterococcus larvae]